VQVEDVGAMRRICAAAEVPACRGEREEMMRGAAVVRSAKKMGKKVWVESMLEYVFCRICGN